MRYQEEQVQPQVGMGATLTLWTDRKVYTIIAVSKSGKSITMQRDKAVLVNGFNSGEKDALHFSPGGFVGHTSGQQRYEYQRDPEGEIIKASLRKNGRWKQSGVASNVRGMSVQIGVRAEHYDFNF